MKLYHWTAKKRKYRILQFGLTLRPCSCSPTSKGIFASDVPKKWENAIKYENDSGAICFSFFSDGLKIIKSINDYIVLENVPANRLTFEEDLSKVTSFCRHRISA